MTSKTVSSATLLEAKIHELTQQSYEAIFAKLTQYCWHKNHSYSYSVASVAIKRELSRPEVAAYFAQTQAFVQELAERSERSKGRVHLLDLIHGLVHKYIGGTALHSILFDRKENKCLVMLAKTKEAGIDGSATTHHIAIALEFNLETRSVPTDAPRVEQHRYVSLDGDSTSQEAQMCNNFALGNISLITVKYLGYCHFPASVMLGDHSGDTENGGTLNSGEAFRREPLQSAPVPDKQRRELESAVEEYEKYLAQTETYEESPDVALLDEITTRAPAR